MNYPMTQPRHTGMAHNAPFNRDEPDRSLHVEFYTKPVFQKKESHEQGREIYKDVEYCRIRFPGDKNKVIDQPAHDKVYLDKESGRRMSYADRFYQHYEIFKHGEGEQVIGTPLRVAAIMTPAKCEEFAYMGVRTVEQLASVADGTLRKMGMGARDYRDKARDYLERHNSGAAQVEELRKTNETLMERLTRMEEELAAFRDDKVPQHVREAEPVKEPERKESKNPKAKKDETEPDPYEDIGQDLGAGLDFENWDEDTLRPWLADMHQQMDRDAVPKDWDKERMVKESRAIALERMKALEEARK